MAESPFVTASRHDVEVVIGGNEHVEPATVRRVDAVPLSPQGFASGVATPGFVLPSGSGTEIGATLTLATPLSCVIPIFCAVERERSTIRPFTYGPRSSIVTTALWPV